jgi:hypothetical protein
LKGILELIQINMNLSPIGINAKTQRIRNTAMINAQISLDEYRINGFQLITI